MSDMNRDDSLIEEYQNDLNKLKEKADMLEDRQLMLEDALESCPMSYVLLENYIIKYLNQSTKRLIGARVFDNIRMYITDSGEYDKIIDELELNGVVAWRGVTVTTRENEEIECLIYITPKKYDDKNCLAVWFCEKGNSEFVQSNIELLREISEKNSRAKSEFIIEMGHEIRTPMNAVLGFSNIIKGTELSEKQREFIQKIEDSARSLFTTINNILDFSKIEVSKLEFYTVEFKLSDILMDLQTYISLRANEKSLIYETDIGTDIAKTYYSDPIRLKQILRILLDNAIDFTSQGKVSLTIKEQKTENGQSTLLFEIRDTGIGMSNYQIAELFAPMSVADAAAVRKYGGVGLNLIVAKKLVRLFGGEIWCESRVDEGSCFSFTAVLSTKNNENASLENSEFDSGEFLYDDSDVNKNKQVNILVVEDIDLNSMIMDEFLKFKGYSTDFATNGEEAVLMIKSKKYDLVFMDIRMPVMDGLTATREIRKLSEFKDLPIIAMTAHARPEDRQRSLTAGMNSHITKPIEAELVYKAIRRWVNKKD